MSTAQIIDGKAAAAALRADIAVKVAALKQNHGLTPGLAVVLVGEDPASAVYVRNKGQAVVGAGMTPFDHKLPATVTEDELLLLVQQLNQDPAVHGILVQLPLPAHIDSARVLAAIDPAKDVDGFHPVNVGRLSTGLPSLVPCTPQGCMILLRNQLGSLAGKRALVLGRSNIVGKAYGATAVAGRLHSDRRAFPHRRSAGRNAAAPKFWWLRSGVRKWCAATGLLPAPTVIDVGINRITLPDGKSRLGGRCAL